MKNKNIETKNILFEDVNPDPEYLIKSIAEQGYTLETALADLIDNSISANANRVEVLTNFSDSSELKLYISDNGDGMNSLDLAKNMKFPSSSVDNKRKKSDLGRFGLGLKTASFSQTRKFTVISRIREGEFSARTWDVDYLKETKKWRIIVNKKEEIKDFLLEYDNCSKNFNSKLDSYIPNTIIIWQGLYKFQKFIDPKNRENSLIEQLNKNTREYLGIVFHRFLNKKTNPLKIRINNWMVDYFDPFPISTRNDLRSLGVFEKNYRNDIFRVEAFVLPSSAIREEKRNGGWVTPNRNLMDLEGMYIYRGDRIIYFGGWNGLIKRQSNLKLARLKVDVGNVNDDLLNLNVSKSKISVPYELSRGLLEKVSNLRDEAKKEYFNHGLKEISSSKNNEKDTVFKKVFNSKQGAILELNQDYPALKSFINDLNLEQKKHFKMIMHIVNVSSNRLLDKHIDREIIGVEEIDKIDLNSILEYIKNLKNMGFGKEKIKELALKDLGFKENNLPKEIFEILEKI